MAVDQMSEADLENFLNEINLMRGLRPHSNVVQVSFVKHGVINELSYLEFVNLL